jgi:hypothetical protein
MLCGNVNDGMILFELGIMCFRPVFLIFFYRCSAAQVINILGMLGWMYFMIFNIINDLTVVIKFLKKDIRKRITQKKE